jgi:hypothetical protein
VLTAMFVAVPALPNSLLHFRDRPVKVIVIPCYFSSARIGDDKSGPFFCEMRGHAACWVAAVSISKY